MLLGPLACVLASTPFLCFSCSVFINAHTLQSLLLVTPAEFITHGSKFTVGSDIYCFTLDIYHFTFLSVPEEHRGV